MELVNRSHRYHRLNLLTDSPPPGTGAETGRKTAEQVWKRAENSPSSPPTADPSPFPDDQQETKRDKPTAPPPVAGRGSTRSVPTQFTQSGSPFGRVSTLQAPIAAAAAAAAAAAGFLSYQERYTRSAGIARFNSEMLVGAGQAEEAAGMGTYRHLCLRMLVYRSVSRWERIGEASKHTTADCNSVNDSQTGTMQSLFRCHIN